MYSVELLQNNTIFIQLNKSRIKHGPKGKVLMITFKEIAQKIQSENNQ